MAFLDLKVIKKKKVDSKSTMTISENMTGDRVFIEFSTNDGRLRLEKSFPASGLGIRDAGLFQDRFRSTDDLLKYFNIPKEK